MDWASRFVLAWEISNTLDAAFCVEAFSTALYRDGKREIFKTDQGSQSASAGFTGALTQAGVTISMDGRGRFIDNIFIERPWRSLNYEAVYLHDLADGFHARRVIGDWLEFYDTIRPHSSLGDRTPIEVYGAGQPAGKAMALPAGSQARQRRQSMIHRALAE